VSSIEIHVEIGETMDIYLFCVPFVSRACPGSPQCLFTGSVCVLVNLDGCEVVCVIRVPLCARVSRVYPCLPVCVSRVCPGSPGVSFSRTAPPCLSAWSLHVPLRKHSRGPLPP
jgi:hypothetical protein